MSRITAGLFGFFFLGAAVAGLLGPTNYDECILANMKGVGSDVAARAVATSCSKQFPPLKPAVVATPAKAERGSPAPADARPGTGSFTDFVPDRAK